VASIIDQFPAFAPLASIPEIAALLNQGANENWTADMFVGHLMGTNWWRTHSKTERDYLAMTLGDPAEAARQTGQSAMSILEQAAQMGVGISLTDAHALAVQSIQQGWDASMLQYQIASRAKQGIGPGSISATQTDFRGIASQQGLNLSDATTFDWAKRVAEGTATTQGFTDYARIQAAFAHPYWAKQINEGATVRQLADPYIQNAARLLETSPDNIDLSDSRWSFTNQNKDGTQTPMSQDQWSTKLMSDPKYGWDQTDNAKQAAYQMVDQLQKSFGAAR
jgi:hypothetical protein